jgi:hypothetical protein
MSMDLLFGVRTRLLGDWRGTFIGCGNQIMLRSVIFQCIAEYGINIFLLSWQSIFEFGAG